MFLQGRKKLRFNDRIKNSPYVAHHGFVISLKDGGGKAELYYRLILHHWQNGMNCALYDS